MLILPSPSACPSSYSSTLCVCVSSGTTDSGVLWKRKRLIWWEVDVLLPASGWEKDNLWTHRFAGSWKQWVFFLTKNNPQKKLSLWTNTEVWLKLNNHLNSRRAVTIKDFNLCSRFSSFAISYSTCAVQSFWIGPCVCSCGPFTVPFNVVGLPVLNIPEIFSPSFHENLKGWQI